MKYPVHIVQPQYLRMQLDWAQIQYIPYPLRGPNLGDFLKVPKCEIFHPFDFNDFYGVKSLYYRQTQSPCCQDEGEGGRQREETQWAPCRII